MQTQKMPASEFIEVVNTPSKLDRNTFWGRHAIDGADLKSRGNGGLGLGQGHGHCRWPNLQKPPGMPSKQPQARGSWSACAVHPLRRIAEVVSAWCEEGWATVVLSAPPPVPVMY